MENANTSATTNTMVLYNTTLGMFILASHPATEAALKEARAKVGETAWKGGFTDPKAYPQGATAVARDTLAKANVPMKTGLEGRIVSVRFAETKHNGGTSEKIRVVFEKDSGPGIMLSQDLTGEFAHKLIQKLENVPIKSKVFLSGWGESVTRNGRTFGNHNVSIKDEEGKELPITPGHFAKCKEATDEAIEGMIKFGVCNTEKEKSAVRKTKLNAYHKDLLLAIQLKFEQARTAQPA